MILRIPVILVALKTPITIPIPTPVLASTPTFKKKSLQTIPTVISLNSLRVIPPSKPSLRPNPAVSIVSITPIPPTPTPTFEKKLSTRPVISLNPLRVGRPSTPSTVQASSDSIRKLTWEELRTKIVQAREYSESLIQEAEEYIKSTGYKAPPPSLPASPSSIYKPPHLRQDSNPVPSVGPPFVTQVSIVKGCFYCHNKYVDKDGLFIRHKHRNKCPWFQHHLAVGTCHLNDVGELCLGPKLVGRQGIPLPFWNSKISQGEQVKRRTDGTEYDEVLANRLRNPVVFKHY